MSKAHIPSPDQQWLDAKRSARMDSVGQLPAQLRELVHVYGLYVVTTFLQCGVTKPKHIRHLVETVLDEFSPTRGSYSSQGLKTERQERN